MPYSDDEARQDMLDAMAEATDQLASALVLLGAAYEQLDERQADQLEEQLFLPAQRAYGRAKRVHFEFAARHDLPGREFETPPPGVPSTGVRGFIDAAVEAVAISESELVELQDSLMPVEVGDQELREGLAEVRRLIDGFAHSATGLLRTLGR